LQARAERSDPGLGRSPGSRDRAARPAPPRRQPILGHLGPHRRQLDHLHPLVGRIMGPALRRQRRPAARTRRRRHDHHPVNALLTEQRPMLPRMPGLPALPSPLAIPIGRW
jgi:hypothetical protein